MKNSRKRDTRFPSGVSGNETAKWRPGQSGNPAGRSKRRAEFEETFNEALITQGSPVEAAQLLWQAARNKEPWAIQELCRRFAPQTQSHPTIPETPYEHLDFTKLSNEQLRVIDDLFKLAGHQPAPPDDGKSAA